MFIGIYVLNHEFTEKSASKNIVCDFIEHKNIVMFIMFAVYKYCQYKSNLLKHTFAINMFVYVYVSLKKCENHLN